jgi:hypothetical protein
VTWHNYGMLETEEGGEGDFPWTGVTIKRWPVIPHYYGDAARMLLVIAAGLMLIASPWYGDNLRVEFPFELVGALIAIACAGLTDPRIRIFSFADLLVAGVGVAVYAMWGVAEYGTINPIAFVLRLAIAVIFMFAFYFSVKTTRAFALHEIGKRDEIDDFEEESRREEDETLEEETTIKTSTPEDRE